MICSVRIDDKTVCVKYLLKYGKVDDDKRRIIIEDIWIVLIVLSGNGEIYRNVEDEVKGE